MREGDREHLHQRGYRTVKERHEDAESSGESDEYAKRAMALEQLVIERGLCTKEEIDKAVQDIDTQSPANGATVVARAWVDPDFKERLLSDAKAALAELGYIDSGHWPDLVVLENTEELHHLVVCTLCSCYPRWLLGRPPDWYKSLTYRSLAVADPRRVINEFGLELGADVEVRVVDSTADIRYMVLPLRPSNTEYMSETELTKLVTRDSMIGVSAAWPTEVAPSK